MSEQPKPSPLDSEAKFKIEEVERDYGPSGTFFVASVRRPRRRWVPDRWDEIGRTTTKAEAEELCRRHERRKTKINRWFYSANMSPVSQ